jgi:amino acid transporter
MKRIVLIYGLIAGAITASLMILTMIFLDKNPDFESAEIIGFLGMLIALSMIFVAVFQHRKIQEGKITFGKAFMTGLYVTLIAGFIYSLTWEIYYTNFANDFMEVYAQNSLQKLRESGASEADIELEAQQSAIMMGYYKNPFFRFGMTLMEIVPIGIVLSIIAGLIFKRK